MMQQAAAMVAAEELKECNESPNFVIFGFGSIGCGLLPLLIKRVLDASRIKIITADRRNEHIAKKYGVVYTVIEIKEDNYKDVCVSNLTEGDFLVNLSVNISSKALMEWCHEANVLYTDTCIEPWEGFYTDPSVPPERRSNYALRHEMLDLRAKWARESHTNNPTALMAHGANPGLVSHFVKRALLNITTKHNPYLLQNGSAPTTKSEWADLAERVGLKVIHIAERDTQRPKKPKEVGEFVNTWSVDGFVSEGLQPAELGWGSHEKDMPLDGQQFDWGCNSSIWLERPGCVTQCRSWTPNEGAYKGWIITHNESISISDYFSSTRYRPTVHYAYHPCDSAVSSMHELAGKNFNQQARQRVLGADEIHDGGMDELGVLLMGDFGAYWYGSQLSIDATRKMVPHNTATSLQVTATVMAGILWCLEHPCLGVTEADQLPHEEILAEIDPFLGKLHGEWTKWTPLQDRGLLFPEDIDDTDPWQFKNFRVI